MSLKVFVIVKYPEVRLWTNWLGQSATYNLCWELLSWLLSLIVISPSVSSSLDRGPGPPKLPAWLPRWRSLRDLSYERPLWEPLPLRLRNCGMVLSSCSEKKKRERNAELVWLKPHITGIHVESKAKFYNINYKSKTYKIMHWRNYLCNLICTINPCTS